MEQTKYDIFISYSRQDADIVNRIVEELTAAGFTVWIDKNGIESGDAFKGVIVKAIENSHTVLFFSSRFSNESYWITKEISVAIYEKKTIIPIHLDDSKYNSDLKFDLINLDYIDLSEPTLVHNGIKRLIKSIKNRNAFNDNDYVPVTHESEPLTPSRETELVSPSKPKSKTWLWAAIAAAVIAIGAIAYFLIPRGGKPEGSVAGSDTAATAADTTLLAGMDGEVDEQAGEDETPTPAPAQQTDQPTGQQQPAQQQPASDPVVAQQPTQPVQPAPAPQPVAPSNSLSGTERGHEWVDMGTSVKWATTNVGSSTPKGNGNYYAWGETSTKDEYTSSNSKTYKDGSVGNIAGDSRYDAARANWGGDWRMPTKEEWQELIDKCAWTWYGSGYEVKAKNGNVLYLPAAGCRITLFGGAGEIGFYWSASPDGSEGAWGPLFNSGGKPVKNYYRNYGFSVRPVLE